MSNGYPQCVNSCQDTYLQNQNQSCYGNPQSAGSPTLCLQVQKNSGTSFKYRICKQGGSFINSFTYRLKDDNHLVFFSSHNGSPGMSCTPWENFQVSYIPGYGPSNGAGVVGEVVSPSGCNQASCKYKTGSITISKSCQ